MFGYTVPLYSAMSASDLAVYRSCYCETCHRLRDDYGIVSTAAVNYDMTFNGMMLNAVSKDGISEQNVNNGIICVLGKPSGENEILRKMAGYTILLTKWELEDDRNDRPSLRSNAARIVLGRAVRKAERSYPGYDEHLRNGFIKLREMETDGNTDAVMIGRTFASSLVPAMEDIAGDLWSDHLRDMFISLGTAIYVMDAVDDLDEDYMNGTYNPFLAECVDFVNGKDLIARNVYEITEMIGSVMKDLQTSYLSVRGTMRFHQGVTDNIILRGLPGSAKRVIGCECSSRPGIRNTISSRILRRNG
jgi:hypothetical protein